MLRERIALAVRHCERSGERPSDEQVVELLRDVRAERDAAVANHLKDHPSDEVRLVYSETILGPDPQVGRHVWSVEASAYLRLV